MSWVRLLAVLALASLAAIRSAHAQKQSLDDSVFNDDERKWIKRQYRELFELHYYEQCVRSKSTEKQGRLHALESGVQRSVTKYFTLPADEGNFKAMETIRDYLDVMIRECPDTPLPATMSEARARTEPEHSAHQPARDKWRVVEIQPAPPGFQHHRREDAPDSEKPHSDAVVSAARDLRRETEEIAAEIFGNRATEAAIDRAFIQWSEEWSFDLYQPASAHIGKMSCDALGCRATGRFSFGRGPERHTIDFSAAIVSVGNGRYYVGQLCYFDNTVGQQECTE